MKKILYLILAIAISSFTFIGCISDEDALSTNDIEEAINRGRNLKRESNVTFQDVKALVNSLQKGEKTETRATGEEKFVFIIDDENDTLFYVVNHPGGGWTMYASDKRVPAIVAKDSAGEFCQIEMERVMGSWFEAMKEDMKTVKKAEDNILSFTDEEIEKNKGFWEHFQSKKITETRGHGEPIEPIEPNRPHGHYEYYATGVYEEYYDCIDHLTQTKWHQDPPYNTYCPDKHGVSGKSPAGCVAIAGAQMIYFLHYKIGIPETIPDTAYCYGDNTVIPRNWNQWYSGSDIWGSMPNHGNKYSEQGYYVNEGSRAAPLIAFVGKQTNMIYGNEQSGAYPSSLVNNVFGLYGISCQYASFNATFANNSLLAGMPIIAVAVITENTSFAHTFIIDAYQRVRTVTSDAYQWIPDPGYENTIMPADMFIKTYSSPYIKYYKMNWGEGDSPYDNTWFMDTGSWLAFDFHFDLSRHMIYGFGVVE